MGSKIQQPMGNRATQKHIRRNMGGISSAVPIKAGSTLVIGLPSRKARRTTLAQEGRKKFRGQVTKRGLTKSHLTPGGHNSLWGCKPVKALKTKLERDAQA